LDTWLIALANYRQPAAPNSFPDMLSSRRLLFFKPVLSF